MSSRHRPSRSSFRADGAIPNVAATAHASAHATMSSSGRGAVSRLATSATTTSPFVRRATSRTGATASTRSLSPNRSRYSRIAGSAPNCFTRICWTVIVAPPALLDRTLGRDYRRPRRHVASRGPSRNLTLRACAKSEASEVADPLQAAGFTQTRTEILDLDPPVVCVLGTNPDPSRDSGSPASDPTS